MLTEAPPRSPTHSSRVPVEHRVLGLDRRTFVPALIALLVYALWAWVLPWIDGLVAWDDPIEAGEAIQVTGEVTIVPPTGWGVISGLRAGERTLSGATTTDRVELSGDGVEVTILTGPFDGSPSELLDQAELIAGATTPSDGYEVLTDPRSTTTSSGLTGVVEGFQSQRYAGVSAAFVVDGDGIEIQVVGAPSQMSRQAETIGEMLDSLTSTTEGGGS